MTFVKIILLIALTGLLPTHSMAANPAEAASSELKHFSKLIGKWSTTAERLKPDGSAWIPSPGADWDFYWDYDGFGVRDYYVSPPRSTPVEDEATRSRGINLRTYSAKDKQWVMTWLTAAGAAPTNWTAQSTDETIVMLGNEPAANGFYSRITFFDMTGESFEWKLEWSADQENWTEVSRIHGKRRDAS